MRHPGWKLAFGFVAAAFCLAAAPRTEASAYYTATYVGTNEDPRNRGGGDFGDGGNIRYTNGGVTNQTTGTTFPFAPTAYVPVYSQPAGFFDGLPTNQVYQGATYPILTTYTMRPSAMNGAGVVLGLMPVNRSSNPWSDPAVGYTVRNTDGTFDGFHLLAWDRTYSAFPQLSDSGRILINLYGSAGSGPMLYDVETGERTPVDDLIPPELLAKYSNLAGVFAQNIDGRGDLLVEFIKYDGSDEDVYILTPPGLDAPAPVPEPSVLWFAAAAVAGLGFRARRRRDG